MARAVVTLGGVGRLRPAPGTWGSAAVLPAVLLGPLACLGLAFGLGAAGWWALRREAAVGDDPGWIVVDEGVGQLLALAALPAGTGWPGVALAFALFRGFDVLKPGPVGWADRREGALGVMLDDVIAGAMAAGVILLVRILWPGVPL